MADESLRVDELANGSELSLVQEVLKVRGCHLKRSRYELQSRASRGGQCRRATQAAEVVVEAALSSGRIGRL